MRKGNTMFKVKFVKATVCGLAWAMFLWIVLIVTLSVFLSVDVSRLLVLALLISAALSYFEILPGTKRSQFYVGQENGVPSELREGTQSVPGSSAPEEAEGPVSALLSKPESIAGTNSAKQRPTTKRASIPTKLLNFVQGAFRLCNSNKVASISLAIATLFACMNTPNESQFTQQYLSLQKSGPDYGSFAANLCDTAISAKFGNSLGSLGPCRLLYEALKDSRPPVNEYHYYGIYSTFYVKDVTSKKTLFVCTGFPIGGASCSLPRN